MSDFYNVWRAISQQETNNELSVTSNKQTSEKLHLGKALWTKLGQEQRH